MRKIKRRARCGRVQEYTVAICVAGPGIRGRNWERQPAIPKKEQARTQLKRWLLACSCGLWTARVNPETIVLEKIVLGIVDQRLALVMNEAAIVVVICDAVRVDVAVVH